MKGWRAQEWPLIIIKDNYSQELHYSDFVIDMISTAICHASCDTHPTAQQSSEVPLLTGFPWKCGFRWGTEHCETTVKPGKTKLPSSNEGKAACPLGYLCSGRAVALVRFIFLFAKNRDLKYQMHLQGIRELTGGKTPNCCIIMFIRKTRFLMEKWQMFLQDLLGKGWGTLKRRFSKYTTEVPAEIRFNFI